MEQLATTIGAIAMTYFFMALVVWPIGRLIDAWDAPRVARRIEENQNRVHIQ